MNNFNSNRFAREVNKTKNRSVLPWLFCSLIIFILLIIFCFYSYIQYNTYTDFADTKTLNTEEITFEVREGETIKSIMQRMFEAGIIKQENVFFIPASDIYLQLNTVDSSSIQPGLHTIPARSDLQTVFNSLRLKECQQFRVTFREGLRIEEYASLIQDQIKDKHSARFNPNEFISIAKNYKNTTGIAFGFDIPSNLEGYLFPDTYQFCIDSTANQIIDRLLRTFEEKVYSQIARDLSSRNKTLSEVVNKASMVEREAFNNDERKVIAGIIENRLEIGMPLGIDATSQYSAGFSNRENTWWPKNADLIRQINIDEPYNTRKRVGLPPTPIANPGLNSIQAVLNPTETDYFYYLHNDCGGIHYGRTLAEHNANVARYIGTGRCE
jgi:UPF0755 protein